MKMNLVKELHKEIDGDNYGMKLYQVGQYEVEVFHTDYASGAAEDDIRVSTVDGCSRYVPKIYYNSEFFGSKAKVFTFGDGFFAIRNCFRKSTHCIQNKSFSLRERIVFIDYNIYGIAVTINDCCNCIASACFKNSNPYHAISLLIPLVSFLRPPARLDPRSGSREPLPA